MTSLRLVFWGLLLVVLDLRVPAVDLLPDPLGWAMAGTGLARLASRHRAFGIAAVASALAALAAMPDWLAPGGRLGTTSGVALVVVLFLVCTAIGELLPERRPTTNLIRWEAVGLSLVVPLLILLGGALVILALALGVVAVAVFVWFLVLLRQCARADLDAAVPVTSRR